MRKPNGFTIIELLTSFTITVIVCVLLFEVVFMVKDLYSTSGLKTEIMIVQANLSKAINQDFNNKILDTVRSCITDYSCITFSFTDGSTSTLEVDSDSIIYQNHRYQFPTRTVLPNEIGICYRYNISTTYPSEYDSMVQVVIPISHPSIKDSHSFDIHATYLYQGSTHNALLYWTSTNPMVAAISECSS